MAAPTTAARVKKTLANPEPSTHGPLLPAPSVRFRRVPVTPPSLARRRNPASKRRRSRHIGVEGGPELLAERVLLHHHFVHRAGQDEVGADAQAAAEIL